MYDVTVQRHLDATPDRVWHALTTAPELAAWIWPESFRTHGEIDLRVPGRYHLASTVAGIGVGGEYRVTEPPTRLVFTWQWDGEADESTVEINLEPSPNGTVLTLDHRGFAQLETRDDHERGWNDCLDRLPAHLATT